VETYSWQFNVVWEYREVFFYGALTTMGMSLIAAASSMVIGLFVGIARLSSTRIIAVVASCYVEILRNTPILVQIFWLFYGLPVLTGYSLSAFWSCTITLSIHFSAYVAEIMRSGISSIDRGQSDAAKVIGFSYVQTFFKIILPQAFRRVIPPLVNNFADIVKLSSLASVIGVYELLHSVNNLIMNSFRPLELYSALAVVYFLLIYPVAFWARCLETRLARR
jgi:polar amino acid transport system permease protein